jgi:hypothetical protein
MPKPAPRAVQLPAREEKKTSPPKYEPPRLTKFDKLEKLIVSGE